MNYLMQTFPCNGGKNNPLYIIVVKLNLPQPEKSWRSRDKSWHNQSPLLHWIIIDYCCWVVYNLLETLWPASYIWSNVWVPHAALVEVFLKKKNPRWQSFHPNLIYKNDTNFVLTINKKMCFFHMLKDTCHFYRLSWKKFFRLNLLNGRISFPPTHLKKAHGFLNVTYSCYTLIIKEPIV